MRPLRSNSELIIDLVQADDNQSVPGQIEMEEVPEQQEELDTQDEQVTKGIHKNRKKKRIVKIVQK